MPITIANVRLAKSLVMDDVPEGGGPPVADVVEDAVSNEIFPDISELDRAGGRVNLRKTFISVNTADRDGFFGVNAIVADPPDDPNVSISLFSQGQVFDERSDAVSKVEAYLNGSSEYPAFLFENHIEGQRVIQLFMRVGQTPPPIGRTLLLRQNEGSPSTVFEQYVRITDVTSEERTFTYSGDVDYKAVVVTCDISDALRYNFTGSPASRSFTRAGGSAIVRDTLAVDAANYYGVVPLAEEVAIDDRFAVCEDVFTRLVPSSQTETPYTDQKPSDDFQITLATSPKLVTVAGSPLAQRIRIGQENRAFNYVTILTPVPGPGSVRIAYRALGNTYIISDNGDGTLGGTGAPGSGTVNYTTGSISVTLNALPDDRSAVVIYWGEKKFYTNRAGSTDFRPPELAFSLEKKGIVPGTLVISWESSTVAKSVTDNGTGQLTGDGEGEINYSAGLVRVRPEAMLDAGGVFEIEYDWIAVEEELHSGLSPDGAGAVSFTLTHQPVAGSVQLMWMTTRTVAESSGAMIAESNTTKTSSGANSSVMTEEERIVPPTWGTVPIYNVSGPPPVPNVPHTPYMHEVPSLLRPGYTETVRTTNSMTAQASTSNTGSYSKTTKQTTRNSVAVAHTITDNGSGAFYGALGTVGYVSKAVVIKVVGDFSETSYESNYERASAFEALNETGEATTTAGGAESSNASTGGGGSESSRGGDSGSATFTEVYGSSTMLARYSRSSATPTAHTETYEPLLTTIDLTPLTRDYVVPGSVKFTWMGHTYSDFEGHLYRDRTEGSDPGVLSGFMNYTTGVASMSDYVVGASPETVTINSLFTTKTGPQVGNMVFMTHAAPIKPSALVFSVVDVTGEQLIGTSDLDGKLDGDHIHGQINYQTGLVEVQFGDYVLDSGLTADQKDEWWYDANDVRTSDGKIWKPWPVDPSTMRYVYVSYLYLPLDADILGLDPVRLPQDGRVPIFRPGSFAVLGHTDTVGPLTVSNSQVVDCERERLSRVRIIGADGAVITGGYTVDLDAGLVTFVNVTGYSQPVTVEHRIEDMAMVSDVQITGKVSFTRAITHAYPVPGSYLSSALVVGDLRARVSLTFDQATWSNNWSDAQSGSAATGTFNDISNPIVVTNGGALTERWAVVFTNSTSFNVIGEHIGVIAVGNTSTDCSPINPASGTPYFTIPAAGWGLGWATGNAFRFNTVGAFYPVWVVRTIQQGPETVPDDSFTLLIRGDVDNP